MSINILFITFYGLIDYIEDIINTFDDIDSYVRSKSKLDTEFDITTHNFSYLHYINTEHKTDEQIIHMINDNISKNSINYVFWFFYPENIMDIVDTMNSVHPKVRNVFYNFDDPKSFNIDLVKKSQCMDYFINPNLVNERKYMYIMDKEIHTVPLYTDDLILNYRKDMDDLSEHLSVNSDDKSIQSIQSIPTAKSIKSIKSNKTIHTNKTNRTNRTNNSLDTVSSIGSRVSQLSRRSITSRQSTKSRSKRTSRKDSRLATANSYIDSHLANNDSDDISSTGSTGTKIDEDVQSIYSIIDSVRSRSTATTFTNTFSNTFTGTLDGSLTKYKNKQNNQNKYDDIDNSKVIVVTVIVDSDYVDLDNDELREFRKHVSVIKGILLNMEFKTQFVMFGPNELEKSYPDIYEGTLNPLMEGSVILNSDLIIVLDMKKGLDKSTTTLLAHCMAYDKLVLTNCNIVNVMYSDSSVILYDLSTVDGILHSIIRYILDGNDMTKPFNDNSHLFDKNNKVLTINDWVLSILAIITQ